MANMFALEWDKVGEKTYEMGVDRGVLYLQDDEGAYTSGEVWNGLINVTESPSGAEANDLYADNIKYASMRSAETFGATIEAYAYPITFERCDGTAEIAKGVKIGQQRRIPFGLSYRTQVGNDTATEKDDGYKIHLVYGCTASPSEKAYGTINESPEAITFSWELSTVAVNVPGFKPTATVTIDSMAVGPDKLAQIEAILYGTPASTIAGTGTTDEIKPRLPLPEELMKILGDNTGTDEPEIAG